MSLKLIKTEKSLYIGKIRNGSVRIESYKTLPNHMFFYNFSNISHLNNDDHITEYLNEYTFTIDNKRFFFDKDRSNLFIKCTSHSSNLTFYFGISLKDGKTFLRSVLPNFKKNKIGEKVKIKIK